MRIAITGADGFIGKNLRFRLLEQGQTELVPITRATPPALLGELLAGADFLFHLAGVNRPQDDSEFATGNVSLTQEICRSLAALSSHAPIVFASSTQATLDNPYGRSKLAAEGILRRYSAETGVPVHVFRLSNVFGKWALPNYNSAVATFCHNLTRGLAIQVNGAAAPLRLVYIDDVVDAFAALLAVPDTPGGFAEVDPVYVTTVGEVVTILRSFAECRSALMLARVGQGLARALYSTYMSYLPPESVAYPVPRHEDARGVFVEMLKTPDCGQFSYFTAHPGVTRGEHYHHSKTEKFLVIRGTARFAFRHIVSGETHELSTCGGEARIVETLPGWAHNVTNVGNDELIVMLWANEVFDRLKPDTVAMKVRP